MLKLGIIGTSAISHSFLAATKETGHYELRAIYSRTLEKASSFAQPYGQVAFYDDLIAFLDSDLDVIYIASPNSLHYPQAKLALLAKKHVILENQPSLLPRNGKSWSNWPRSTRSISLKQLATIMKKPLRPSMIFLKTRPSWVAT